MSTPSAIRPPAVAGMFYPAEGEALVREISRCLPRTPEGAAPPKALVVPHAGYVFSGPVAGTAYARLIPLRARIRRVVLLGPAHRLPFRGLALPSASAFATPLGSVALDVGAMADALRLPQVRINDAAHRLEHSLEVQLPFLQSTLANFALVPLLVGDAHPTEVAEVIDRLWGGEETLIIVSTDLSHFLRDEHARALDRSTVDAILAASAVITHEQACGATPLNGLLICARRRGLAIELLDLCNSGDTAGDRARVVGYASLAFAETSHERH